MPVKWKERFQVYVLNVGNLAAGQSTDVDLPLLLDSDAPFVLKGRGGRCKNDPRYFQAGMNGLLVRYRDAVGNYASDAPVPWYLDVPGNGFGGAWAPVYPEKIYPPQGMLLTTVSNTGPGAVNLTNVHLYYVGVKRFPASTPWETYPQKCSVKDYVYSYWNLSPTSPQLPFQGALMGPSAQLLNIPITIQTDADFVMRSAQAGVYGLPNLPPDYTPNFYMELFVLLMDRWRKPYMNAPVHIDWLFGGGHQSVVTASTGAAGALNPFFLPNNSQSIYQSIPYPGGGGTGIVAPTSGIIPGQTPLVGNWHPGLFYPEIYHKGNTQFYFDLYRYDASYTTAYGNGGFTATIVPPNINLHIAFYGKQGVPQVSLW